MSKVNNQKYDDAYFAKMDKDLEHLKGAPMPCCYSDEELDKLSENRKEVVGWMMMK